MNYIVVGCVINRQTSEVLVIRERNQLVSFILAVSCTALYCHLI